MAIDLAKIAHIDNLRALLRKIIEGGEISHSGRGGAIDGGLKCHGCDVPKVLSVVLNNNT